jgi:uncharacterized membrane protein YsdA (DUF1294 family)
MARDFITHKFLGISIGSMVGKEVYDHKKNPSWFEPNGILIIMIFLMLLKR